jgi:hypothetical protein
VCSGEVALCAREIRRQGAKAPRRKKDKKDNRKVFLYSLAPLRLCGKETGKHHQSSPHANLSAKRGKARCTRSVVLITRASLSA